MTRIAEKEYAFNAYHKAKPFIKWVGGKGQLLSQLDTFLPNAFEAWNEATYIEPFVGGGAMLFYMLKKISKYQKGHHK